MAPRIFRRRRSRDSGASDEGLAEASAETVTDDESPPSLAEEGDPSPEGIEIFDESGDGAEDEPVVDHPAVGDWEGEGGSALPHEDEESSSLAFEPPDEPPPFPFVAEDPPESQASDFSEEAVEETDPEAEGDEEPGQELPDEEDEEEELVDVEDGNLVSSDGELADRSPGDDVDGDGGVAELDEAGDDLAPALDGEAVIPPVRMLEVEDVPEDTAELVDDDEDAAVESVEVTSEDGVEIVPLPADGGAMVPVSSRRSSREPEEAEEIDDEPRASRQPRVTRELGAADEQAALPSGEDDDGRSEIQHLQRRVEDLAQLVRERIGDQPEPATASDDDVVAEANETEARYDEEIAQLRSAHMEEIEEIGSMHRQEVEEARDARREEVEQLKEDQSEELRSLRDTHDAEMRALRAEQALASENFQRELLELGSRLETTERQLGESERKGRDQNERIAERLRETQRENEELRAHEESSQVSESAQRVYASLEQARIEQEADLIAKRDRAITEAGIEAEQIKLAAHVHEGETLTRLAEVADLERNRMQSLRVDAEENVESARQQLNELLETFIQGASSLVAAAKRDSDATRESFLTEKQQLRDENKTLEQQREELVGSTQQITRRLETLLQRLSRLSGANLSAAIALAGESGVDIFAATPAVPAAEEPEAELAELAEEPEFEVVSGEPELEAELEVPSGEPEIESDLDLGEPEIEIEVASEDLEPEAEAAPQLDQPPALLQPLPEDEPAPPLAPEVADSIRSFDELPAVQVAPVVRPSAPRPGEGIRSFDEFIDTGE